MARMGLTITAAAATIGMNRHTFSSRLKKQGLTPLFKGGER
jgi:DNA-binding protein Fis